MTSHVRGVIARSKGEPSRGRHGAGARPGARRGAGGRAGVRRLPHRPALPRGRHRRGLPLPARARGRRGGRGGRRRRDRCRPRRLRDPQLARCVRAVPGVPARAPLVLLRHPQRRAEDDPRGRHGAVARAGHRRVRGEDPGRRRPVHQGRPGRPARGGRAARLRGDGRPRRGAQHRPRHPRRLGRGHRLRRGRRRGGAGRPAGRRADDHRVSTSTTASWSGPGEFGATARDQLPGDRPGRGDPRADRRATAPTW